MDITDTVNISRFSSIFFEGTWKPEKGMVEGTNEGKECTRVPQERINKNKAQLNKKDTV